MAETNGVDCIYVPCDISKPKEIDEMMKTANLKLEDFNECLDVNMIAPFYFCKKVVPLMKENQWGRIINISTAITKVIAPNSFGYTASKNMLHSLTKVLAKEVGQFKISVNCLIPGCVDTDMFNQGIEALAKSLSYSP